MPQLAIEFVNLFLAGLLAGEELAICYGVRTSIAKLDEKPQTQLRQSLIRKLRVLVPAIFIPTAVSSVMVVALAGASPGFCFRCAGLLLLLAWASITFLGTVPINKSVLDWQPEAMPDNWKSIVARWERLDIGRCWAAVMSFTCLLIAAALRLSGN
jgi:hypothetical protein